MKFSLSPDTPKGQAQAIQANEKVITVGAGAGTGKTWVLSQRYLRLLLEDENVTPSNILTLTYTEAAASDMKQRIIAMIEKELEDFHDETRKRKILDSLADSWISTIHAFAGRLIREAGLSLDIDPKASVISSHQENEFWEGIKNAAEFANLRELARAYGNKTLRRTAEFLDTDKYFSAGVSKWRADKLSEFAKNVAELHASSGHTWQEMLGWAENDMLIAETVPLVEKILADEWREVWNIWQDINLPPAKSTNRAGVILTEVLNNRKLYDKSNIEALKNFYISIVLDKEIKANQGEPFKTLKAELGMQIGDWRKTRPELMKKVTLDYDKNFPEEELNMRRSLLKFCALSWGMWSMMKQHRRLLSFSDMILYAKSAIAKGDVNREFAHVLVDEFQDTDRLQFNMINSLAENSNLFVVGDPKQSIYKFRHADPSLFAEIIKTADQRIELDVSFRTRKTLLEKINKLFAALWRDGLGRSEGMTDLRYEALNNIYIDGERDTGTMPDFKIILAQRDKNTTTNEARKILAENLAYKIASWVKNNLTVWDKQEKVIRPVRFSDFAILSRSRSIYPVLEEALDKFGIKSVQDKSTDYFSRGEINDVVCLLRAAANFHDEFAVTGWLMSPFSGVDENNALTKCLTLISENSRPIDLIKQNLPEAFSRLEYLSLVGENEGPAGLLALYDKNRKWLECYDFNDRMRVLRNLRLALSVARNFQNSNLVSCAEYMTRAVRNAIPFEEPAWHDENENAVRLGVVHSAKGLEYPVTVIFEARVKKDVDNKVLRPSRKLGLVFSNIPEEVTDGKEVKPHGSDWEKLLSEQGDTEEEQRLFYVAATRAQDSLIFCGLVDEKGEPHNYTWTKFLLDNIDEVEAEKVQALDADKIQALNYDEEEKKLEHVDVIKCKSTLRQFSASSFALFEWCPFAWRRSYRQGLSLSWELPDDNPDEDFYGGSELGSLTHWILAHENYYDELDYLLYNNENISMLPVYLRDVWRDKKAKSLLENWLKNFAESELGMKLRAEKELKREYRFRLKLNEKITLAGSIDGLYGGNNIIDYKITGVDNVPPGLYEAQLDFYAFVVHKLTGSESVNTSIAFLREGKIETRTCENFAEIQERIERAAEICASGPYNANHKNCGLCPFKKGCVKIAGKF